MVTALAQLRQAIPPRTDTDPSAVDWESIEKEIGTSLAPELRGVIARYGCGSFDAFLSVFHPTTTNPNLNLAKQIEVRLGATGTSSPAR
jgi:hypothetical protein